MYGPRRAASASSDGSGAEPRSCVQPCRRDGRRLLRLQARADRRCPERDRASPGVGVPLPGLTPARQVKVLPAAWRNLDGIDANLLERVQRERDVLVEGRDAAIRETDGDRSFG